MLVIMVWLSCAESLKRKFKELSERDGKAAFIRGECERKEAAEQSVDHFLLYKAKEYGLITAPDFIKLEQIYILRCLYGHPYEFGPNQHNLVSAALDAVDLVLGKQTKLRKGYLSSQVDHLRNDVSFLDDTFPAVERFAHEVAQKCDDSLHWWFLEKLWDSTESIAEDKTLELLFRRNVWFTVAYLRQVMALVSKPWAAIDYLTRFPNTLSRALVEPELFYMLDPHSKDMVLGRLFQNSTADLRILTLLKTLKDKACLDSRMLERFQQVVDARPVDELASTGIDPNLYVSRILSALKSHDWYDQNPAMTVVTSWGPSGVALLQPDQQFALGNNVLQAAEGDAKKAVAFLSWAAESSNTWSTAFVDGLITECFINESNQIRFKNDRLKQALTLLNKLSEPKDVDGLLQRLVDRVANGKIKDRVSPSKREEAKRILDSFAQQQVHFSPQISGLVLALSSLTLTDPFDF